VGGKRGGPEDSAEHLRACVIAEPSIFTPSVKKGKGKERDRHGGCVAGEKRRVRGDALQRRSGEGFLRMAARSLYKKKKEGGKRKKRTESRGTGIHPKKKEGGGGDGAYPHADRAIVSMQSLDIGGETTGRKKREEEKKKKKGPDKVLR